MAANIDIEASGLLDGLDGDARAERAELIAWLLQHGFTVEQLRGAIAPMLLPARRLLGDDGTFVSAREICETHHIDLDFFSGCNERSACHASTIPTHAYTFVPTARRLAERRNSSTPESIPTSWSAWCAFSPTGFRTPPR